MRVGLGKEAGLKHAERMRAHGGPNYPDPRSPTAASPGAAAVVPVASTPRSTIAFVAKPRSCSLRWLLITC